MKALLLMAHATTLFDSPCVNVEFCERSRHLTIAARDAPIDADSVSEVLRLTEVQLEGAKFATTWDLRKCRVPPMDVTARCIRWALKNKSKLDAQNERLVVVGGSPSVNSVVRLVLRVFGPTCATLVTGDSDAASVFMNEREMPAEAWVSNFPQL